MSVGVELDPSEVAQHLMHQTPTVGGLTRAEPVPTGMQDASWASAPWVRDVACSAMPQARMCNTSKLRDISDFVESVVGGGMRPTGGWVQGLLLNA
jgi:hypothetical protein